MFANKHLHIWLIHTSKSKMCYNVIISVHYFYIKTKMLAGFQICISVPLTDDGINLKTLRFLYYSKFRYLFVLIIFQLFQFNYDVTEARRVVLPDSSS